MAKADAVLAQTRIRRKTAGPAKAVGGHDWGALHVFAGLVPATHEHLGGAVIMDDRHYGRS